MNNSYDTLLSHLRKLPGLGYRSAERIAIHLLTDKAESGKDLIQAIKDAQSKLSPCEDCGNLCEGTLCEICQNPSRIKNAICIVENVLDLMAIERSGTWNGLVSCFVWKIVSYTWCIARTFEFQKPSQPYRAWSG